MGPILVVEDDSDTRHALGELLTVLFPGSRVLMAESGEAALELIRRTRPRVVILDLHLGGIQGFDFASRVAAMSAGDRKSTRLNSSHRCISYAVFCLKKKKEQ